MTTNDDLKKLIDSLAREIAALKQEVSGLRSYVVSGRCKAR